MLLRYINLRFFILHHLWWEAVNRRDYEEMSRIKAQQKACLIAEWLLLAQQVDGLRGIIEKETV